MQTQTEQAIREAFSHHPQMESWQDYLRWWAVMAYWFGAVSGGAVSLLIH